MNQQKKSYKVLGIMSGTSFDGIDFCIASFERQNDSWKYDAIAAETISYEPSWKDRILAAEKSTAENLIQLHFEYGSYLGKLAADFIQRRQEKVDFIASHGHTIFHQIDKGLTFQLGHGAAIAAKSGIISISDFRSLDVALGGEGAPLVPIGDQLLFPKYASCINIGGIANISFDQDGKRIAYDMVAANMILNHLCQTQLQIDFDRNGLISRSGSFNEGLFKQLNALSYYAKKAPKSLGKEWVFQHIVPILNQSKLKVEDQLHTYSQHIIHQINQSTNSISSDGIHLISGGGAKNTFLIKELENKGMKVEHENEFIVDFKEALIFAFLGLLRYLGENNTLKEVSGAVKNSSGGTIFLP